MAVIILTDNSFLLNHLDSRVLFPFEKSARMHGFGHASWRLFAYILGKLIRKEASGFRVIWDTQEIESISKIKPVHAPTPHRLGSPSPVRVGVVVAFKNKRIPETITKTGDKSMRSAIFAYSLIKTIRSCQLFVPLRSGQMPLFYFGSVYTFGECLPASYPTPHSILPG